MVLLFVEELKHHIECPSLSPLTDLNIPSWQGVQDFSAPLREVTFTCMAIKTAINSLGNNLKLN
jgi:hypothetical protein